MPETKPRYAHNAWRRPESFIPAGGHAARASTRVAVDSCWATVYVILPPHRHRAAEMGHAVRGIAWLGQAEFESPRARPIGHQNQRSTVERDGHGRVRRVRRRTAQGTHPRERQEAAEPGR